MSPPRAHPVRASARRPCSRTRALAIAAAVCGALAVAPPAAVAQAPVPVPQSGPSLIGGPGVLLGRVMRLRGALPDVPAGAPVQIQRLTPDRGWVTETTAGAGPGGAFVARWRPQAVGRFLMRAVASGEVRAAAAAPTAQVTVYRPARATWYGPGLYGHRTACGHVLSRRLLGVAHRRLACGTPVELYLAGRTVTAPVVDRGPFAQGVDYDLTSATAQQLGLTVTATIGVSPRRGPTTAPSSDQPPPFATTGGTPAPVAVP